MSQRRPFWRRAWIRRPVRLTRWGTGFRIRPTLRVGQDLYEVAYRTTTGFRVDSPIFFALLEGDFLENREIRELRVTKNGDEVQDPAAISGLFVLYRAAYHLYERPLTIAPPEDIPYLEDILESPIKLLATNAVIEQLVEGETAAYEDLLRLVLTDQTARGRGAMETAFGPDWETSFTDYEAILALLEQAAADGALAARGLAAPAADLAQALEGLRGNAKLAGLSTPALAAGVKLAFLWLAGAAVQEQQRAPWLARYLEALPGTRSGLNEAQQKAAQAILTESGRLADRRLEMAGQIVLETALQMGSGLASDALLSWVAAKLGSRLGGGLLGATGSALTVTGAWYNADEWYADFALAKRALELRQAFGAGARAPEHGRTSQRRRPQGVRRRSG